MEPIAVAIVRKRGLFMRLTADSAGCAASPLILPWPIRTLVHWSLIT